jgi:hypothetical protein
MLTVLVLGGYGFFGQRISAALAPSVQLLVAGRDLGRATAATRAIGLPAGYAVAIDARDVNLADALSRLQVDVLIHTAGPFQAQDYSVARAAVDCALLPGRAELDSSRRLADSDEGSRARVGAGRGPDNASLSSLRASMVLAWDTRVCSGVLVFWIMVAKPAV